MPKGTETTLPKECIIITVTYTNDREDAHIERLHHMVSWEHVPNQDKVRDRAKEMVDILYEQVR